MIKGLYTAYTGMINQMNRMDVLTNNLANADTNGYKKEGATTQSFDDVYAYKIKDTSESSTYYQDNLGSITLGVKVGETYTDYSQGSLVETGNTYDVAITGEGFFAISYSDDDGNTYFKLTRDGAFSVDQDGYLRTKDGDYVLNQDAALDGDASSDGYILIDPNQETTIDNAGNIYQNGELVATIGVVDIEDYDYIEKFGENMYQLVDGAEITDSDAGVEQGYIETSNVQVVSEMVDMITVARAYESNQKLIQTIDSMIGTTVTQVGRL
ncbi:MAG: flagellar hook-basal body protein [Eubacterium sp.]|nr:flagellar hook-basal body protein [Eubacterium sp.]